jgi:hypothetical protein
MCAPTQPAATAKDTTHAHVWRPQIITNAGAVLRTSDKQPLKQRTLSSSSKCIAGTRHILLQVVYLTALPVAQAIYTTE